MGFYVEVPRHTEKARQLVDLYHAEILQRCPKSIEDLPKDKALICVVENGPFDAAAFCYSQQEMLEFAPSPRDLRWRTWLTMDYDLACKLSGYKPE